MKLTKPRCPICDQRPVGTVDKVVALFHDLSDAERAEEGIANGDYEYCDQTVIDDQKTITNDAGEILVVCAKNHEWYSAVED